MKTLIKGDKMKKILMTGSTGFIGRNILPILNQSAEILSPKRQDLDLKDENSVRRYLINNKVDFILHCANPNPIKNQLDSQSTMFEDSLRIFMNLYNSSDLYEKLFFLGSGAEYDKTMEICCVKEEECFRSVPKDQYGLAKYIENTIAEKSIKAYNLRVFACYGPNDHPSKFITHCINCCLNDQDITIRQDCYFDYLHVFDLAAMIEWHINNDQKHTSYNMCSGHRVLLSDIAKEVKMQMKSNLSILIQNDGLNKEYTASNERFTSESGMFPAISLEEGISKQIEWEKEKRV